MRRLSRDNGRYANSRPAVLTRQFTERIRPNSSVVPAPAASEKNYIAAAVYSAQNPPQVFPPDYGGEVMMIVDPQAKPEIRNSILIGDKNNTISFISGQDVDDRCIQSNNRIMGYYEVTITQISNKVCLAVGFSTKPYPSFRFPGWDEHSIGYHSDNGHKFFNDPGDGSQYGPIYGKGDTIGCGFTENHDGSSQSFFFTRNGKHLGIAFTTNKLMGETYACIGGDGECSFTINFGNDSSKAFRCQEIHFKKQIVPTSTEQKYVPSIPTQEGPSAPPPYQMQPPGGSVPTATSVSVPMATPISDQYGAPIPYQAQQPTSVPFAAPIPYQPQQHGTGQFPVPTNQSSAYPSVQQYNAPPKQFGMNV